MTRLQQIVELLDAWFVYFPWPETWTGAMLRRSSTPGPAPFRRVECVDCEGNGKRGRWVCMTCKGKGALEVDDYTDAPVVTEETSWKQLLGGTVPCSECGGWGRLSAFADQRPDREARMCERCEGTGRESSPLFGRIAVEREARVAHGDRTLDALERQREMLQRGSFAELAEAMGELHAVDAPGYSLVLVVFALHERTPAALSDGDRERLVGAMLFLEERMPHRIRVPGELVAAREARSSALVRAKGKGADARARDARNEEMKRRWRAGASQVELAAMFQLDPAQVSRILRAA